MEDKTIFDLSTLNSASLADSDLFYVTDVSENETMRMTAQEVRGYIFAHSASIATGSFSGSFYGIFNGTASHADRATTASYTLSSTGEINTASNTGSTLVNGRETFGIYDEKVSYDLRFKKLASGTTGNIRLSENTASKCIEIDAINLSTNPGGAAGHVQFYDGGANTFGGSSNFTWDTSTNTFSVLSGSSYFVSIQGGIISASAINVSSAGTNMYGTASYSVSGSNAVTASHAITASYASSGNQLSSSYAATASYMASGASGLSYIALVSSNTLYTDNLNGNHVTTLHGFGSTPPLLRAVLLCIGADAGYAIDDEIDVFSITDDTGGADDERPIVALYANATAAGVNVGNSPFGFYVAASNAATSTYTAIDKTKWKVKVYIWR